MAKHGDCQCVAHRMGYCPDCGHMLYAHWTEGGCIYRMGTNPGIEMDEARDCECMTARPLQESPKVVELDQAPLE